MLLSELPIRDILLRISELTDKEMGKKTINQLLAAPAEELGELARELKIEHKVYGNEYKRPDEGVKAESVDLFIAGMAMYFADPDCKDLLDQTEGLLFADTQPGDDIWHTFKEACVCLGDAFGFEALPLCQRSINIFLKSGGDLEEFTETCNRKLDKWVKTRN